MASISFLDVPLVEVLIVRGGAVPSGFSLPLWQSTRLRLPRGALLHQLRMVRGSLAAVSPLSLAGGHLARTSLAQRREGDSISGARSLVV